MRVSARRDVGGRFVAASDLAAGDLLVGALELEGAAVLVPRGVASTDAAANGERADERRAKNLQRQ
jgi:hypothetical protein